MNSTKDRLWLYGREILKEAAALLFPPRCVICGAFCRSPICLDCRQAFEVICPPLCTQCGRPFDPHLPSVATRCSQCANSPDYLNVARSFGLHVGGLREAINKLKFEGRLSLVPSLGTLLAEVYGNPNDTTLALGNPPPTALVPVPLHPIRRQERGFDQAELLAEQLSQLIGLPVWNGLLVRTRYTPPQVGLSPHQRRRNVRGAFELRKPLPQTDVCILLVDDVYTTGATLQECARVLRRKGVARVCAVTVSRAAPDWHPAVDLLNAL
ncbi:MAG: ComF family protein [Candidatus Zipacnadales bacterium]